MDTKQHEAMIAEAGATIGGLAYQAAKAARGLWLQTTAEVIPLLDGVTDAAVAQATLDGIMAKGAAAYAAVIAKNVAKDRLWLPPSGKAKKTAVKPDGCEEATPFTSTSVGQYLRQIKAAIGHGIDKAPKDGERHGDWRARLEATQGAPKGAEGGTTGGTQPPAAEGFALLSATTYSKPAETLAKAADASDGKAEPFVKAFAAAASEAAAMDRTTEFWQHMAAEAATWVAARKKADAILAQDDEPATGTEG